MRRKTLLDIWDRLRERAGLLVLLAFATFIACAFTDLKYNHSSNGLYFLLMYAALCLLYPIPAGFSGTKRYSDFDDYIIGDAFRGFDPASKTFRRGMKYFRGRNMSMALQCFRDADGFEPKERDAAVLYYYTAMVYRYMSYPTNSALYFEKSADISVLHPSVLLNAEREFSSAGNTVKAEEMIERMYSLEYNLKYYNFLEVERGRIYLDSENADEAERIFLEAMENGNDTIGCLCGLAIAGLMKGECEKSRGYYRKAAVRRDFAAQGGFPEYYAQVASACGFYDNIKDLLPSSENDKETAELAENT